MAALAPEIARGAAAFKNYRQQLTRVMPGDLCRIDSTPTTIFVHEYIDRTDDVVYR